MDDLERYKTYKIGQAAELLGLKTYVLRFWETEFPQIEPVRTATGQRLYTEEHLETIRTIKHLLYDEGLTIEGARKRLDDASASRAAPTDPAPERVRMPSIHQDPLLLEIRAELEAIRKLLVP